MSGRSFLPVCRVPGRPPRGLRPRRLAGLSPLALGVSMSGMRRRRVAHGGKPFTFECAACGKQTSVTAGTILHGRSCL